MFRLYAATSRGFQHDLKAVSPIWYHAGTSSDLPNRSSGPDIWQRSEEGAPSSTSRVGNGQLGGDQQGQVVLTNYSLVLQLYRK